MVKKNAAEPRERFLVIETEFDKEHGFMFLLLADDGRFIEEEATSVLVVSNASVAPAMYVKPGPTPIAMPIPSDGVPPR